jgi:hypothetical protein
VVREKPLRTFDSRNWIKLRGCFRGIDCRQPIDLLHVEHGVAFEERDFAFQYRDTSEVRTDAGSGNLFATDINGDGKLDLLSADGTLQLGNGDGTFRAGARVSGTPVAVGDFNGDARPDVLEMGTGTLLVLLGNDTGAVSYLSMISLWGENSISSLLARFIEVSLRVRLRAPRENAPFNVK